MQTGLTLHFENKFRTKKVSESSFIKNTSTTAADDPEELLRHKHKKSFSSIGQIGKNNITNKVKTDSGVGVDETMALKEHTEKLE